MKEQFGTMPTGDPVYRMAITNGRLVAYILSYGASVQDLRLAGHAPSLVLGFADFQSCLKNNYFGSMVGRVANRIANARFELEGTTFSTDRNFQDQHTLHGGREGISQQNWKVIDHGTSHVTLQVTDLGAVTGFPGDCTITCTYEIGTDDCLISRLSATATADTPINIAHHSYFNLDGAGDILDHHIQIQALHYLPVDDGLIPTGGIRSVTGTGFDFTRSRPMNHGSGTPYDHNFCLGTERGNLKPAATITAARSGVSMEVSTTEPGIQFYTGENLNTMEKGLNGEVYRPHFGFALEPQGWPDAINQAGFPPTLVRKGETYRQESRFCFTLN